MGGGGRGEGGGGGHRLAAGGARKDWEAFAICAIWNPRSVISIGFPPCRVNCSRALPGAKPVPVASLGDRSLLHFVAPLSNEANGTLQIAGSAEDRGCEDRARKQRILTEFCDFRENAPPPGGGGGRPAALGAGKRAPDG